jgi:hypothetical protein
MFGFKHIKFDAMTYVLHFKTETFQKKVVDFLFSTFHQIVQLLHNSMGSNDLHHLF